MAHLAAHYDIKVVDKGRGASFYWLFQAPPIGAKIEIRKRSLES